jgi:dTDP-4-dehydrorhamnose reductase
MKKQSILVLGADGLVGQTVFLSLQALFPNSVWGTVRNKNHLSASIFPFSVSDCETDFESIHKKVGKITYVINCIGVTKESDKKLLHLVNTVFPHKLQAMIQDMQTKLFHISSDAVFSPLCGEVTEQDTPLPVTEYGKSKLAGETSTAHALTIRSSFLGFDMYHKKGLLEKTFHKKNY